MSIMVSSISEMSFTSINIHKISIEHSHFLANILKTKWLIIFLYIHQPTPISGHLSKVTVTDLTVFSGGSPRGTINWLLWIDLKEDSQEAAFTVSSSACPKCSHCMHTGRVKCKWRLTSNLISILLTDNAGSTQSRRTCSLLQDGQSFSTPIVRFQKTDTKSPFGNCQCDCQPYMSLTRTFLLGDICVQAIEHNHVDNVIALIEAKANINPKNVASARRGMPTHLYCVSVSLCVCRLCFLRCYELLQEDISIVSSHCSKPELTSTSKMKCVLVLPVCGLMTVPAMTVPTMPMTCHQSRRYSMVTMRLRRREILKIDVGEMSSQRSNRFSCFAICGSSVSYVYVVCNNSTLHYVML